MKIAYSFAFQQAIIVYFYLIVLTCKNCYAKRQILMYQPTVDIHVAYRLAYLLAWATVIWRFFGSDLEVGSKLRYV